MSTSSALHGSSAPLLRRDELSPAAALVLAMYRTEAAVTLARVAPALVAPRRRVSRADAA
jgi:hypothetical protein